MPYGSPGLVSLTHAMVLLVVLCVCFLESFAVFHSDIRNFPNIFVLEIGTRANHATVCIVVRNGRQRCRVVIPVVLEYNCPQPLRKIVHFVEKFPQWLRSVLVFCVCFLECIPMFQSDIRDILKIFIFEICHIALHATVCIEVRNGRHLGRVVHTVVYEYNIPKFLSKLVQVHSNAFTSLDHVVVCCCLCCAVFLKD